eukprot:TRINITY_DN10640_c0_g1_i1.p1 TRINITY_DN10640_c0_g1~~TRINITY_DN10640_c0_g1_i1.p1  ORF type:complete len:442 (+),score=114.42 TRINITY_DN10640_c0_g1_i1:21-1346(+)
MKREVYPEGIKIDIRPEIRKGCSWDVKISFSADLLEAENIKKIYYEKPRHANPSCYYFCLKVRSKLITPIKEVGFTKVATLASDSSYTELSGNTATFKVKFNARPRAVFHKHADMMILVASLKKGDTHITTGLKELIFRGGTGSIHSADSRKKALLKEKSRKNNMKKEYPTTADGGLWPIDRTVPEFTHMAPDELLTSFIQNKGDALLQYYGDGFEGMNNNTTMDNTWASNVMAPQTNDFSMGVSNFSAYPVMMDNNNMAYPGNGFLEMKPDISSNYNEPNYNLGSYNEPNLKKRKLEYYEEPATKRPKYLMETKTYQKLFFNALHYLTLPEISTVASRAPVPLFVKDENSRYIYLNSTFANFVLDVATTDTALNKGTSQVLDPCDAPTIMQHDQYMFTQEEGVMKLFDVTIKHQYFQMMKQVTTLRDGKKVIVGAVVGSL